MCSHLYSKKRARSSRAKTSVSISQPEQLATGHFCHAGCLTCGGESVTGTWWVKAKWEAVPKTSALNRHRCDLCKKHMKLWSTQQRSPRVGENKQAYSTHTPSIRNNTSERLLRHQLLSEGEMTESHTGRAPGASSFLVTTARSVYWPSSNLNRRQGKTTDRKHTTSCQGLGKRGQGWGNEGNCPQWLVLNVNLPQPRIA